MTTITRPSATQAPAGAAPRRDRLTWLWLVVGVALLCVGQFRTVVPLAAWLGPVFLLRFVRSQRPVVGLPLAALAGFIVVMVGLRGVFGLPQLAVFALGGTTMALAYGADRLLAPRLGAVARTLVFPATDVAIAFLSALASSGSLATFGSPAYAEAGNLPLVQVVAVGGLWSLHFLMSWTAPVANGLWERGFDLRAARAVVTPFAVVLVAVLLAGGARVAFLPPGGDTVRIAAIAPDAGRTRAAMEAVRAERLPLDDAERARFRARWFDPVTDDLFARTREAADGGARIVSWSEVAAPTFQEDEAALLDRARAVARDEDVWLQVGLVTYLPVDRHPFVEIRAVLISPAGTVASDYAKSTRVLGDGNVPGPGAVEVVDTPYGRIATVICFDADLPWLVRQAGRQRADILLAPSSDWQPVAELHARMATLRAVENGVSLVRPTRDGVSLATDPHGRLLGYRADLGPQTLYADVPTEGTPTPYAVVGEGVAMASIIALVALTAIALARRRPR